MWSIAERRWLTDAPGGLAWVGSNGFDSLILRIPTRGFGTQVRSEDGWRSASDAAGVVEPLPPIPQRAGLHARVELAHLAEADLFVSLHSNAAHNEHNDWQRGLEAWYYPSPSGDGANAALAQILVDAVGAALAEWGYDSSCWEIH